ncbi:MAG: YebC/PmpR family DNA-binding transcriptional regulator [Chloroflexota bacterium]
MSGHSHWSTIKRKKGAADARKGAIFTRLAREIALASREGGGDPRMNISLEMAIEHARASNMPKDSIERAIKRGTGEDKAGVELEEISYEGYASHGIALIVECVTENRNRTVADVRHILTRAGGALGENGSVSWQFDRVSYFAINADGVDFDKVFEIAVEAGAEDIQSDEEYIEIYGSVGAFKTILDNLSKSGIKPEEAKLHFLPKLEIELDKDKTLKVMRIIEDLEEIDDVQNVFSNLKISEEAIAAIEVS